MERYANYIGEAKTHVYLASFTLVFILYFLFFKGSIGDKQLPLELQ
ncbi:hypothetical protein B5M42_001090 [Paenibacillus athensensis]|nr:hypothetical protein [Paenibacillus athensensis]MCD1257431.1 hypothetical protein [Paenibacillus athensensis]